MTFLKTIALAATSVGLVVFNQPSRAQDGYDFNLTLTHKNVSHDPDGLWDDSNFTPSGEPPELPNIYTARLTTPAGEWILSQLDTQCTMQSDCAFILALKKKDGKLQKLASGSVIMGGKATLSLNYKKITTEEVDDAAKPFTGSYNVEPVK
ncbi:hypothetical protein CU102_24020 [Phyllobacterium brassicacearum]|uniref:Uncharacterized protein n=1 Tax=Phyllobacterium brassicacearum TaxID=314235 RepID=A0A2P7BA37_9HYPH|nr:hypothetical protein [Phyllobacterium brassicacearum]PSH63334.1 hypothetical protein CU102_24020 [Phyllobacterium brassicacearum]TDQ18184.1 hypothetical protein DEV91_12547 [Phyllobacterium brassicacearum]